MAEQESDNELRDFIKETLRQIDEGNTGHSVSGEVEFEVAVSKSVTGGGKLSIKVLGVEGEIKTEHVSKIKFKTNMIRAEETERTRRAMANVPRNAIGYGL